MTTENIEITPPTPKRIASLIDVLDAHDFAVTQLGFEPDEPQSRVLRAQSEQAILNCSRQWGKSTVCAIKALHTAWSRPDSLVLVASPSARQSAEFVRKVERFVKLLGIVPRGDGDNEISVQLPNGSRIVGIPGNEATTRGFSAVAMLLIDEAAKVSDELYYSLRPTLAHGRGSLWLLSTPYGKRGFFYDEWARGGSDWTRFTVPAVDCARISPSFLERERRALGPRYFAQEYECEFHGTREALFSEEQIRRAVSSEVSPLFGNAVAQTIPAWIAEHAVTNVLSRDYFIGVDFGQRCDHSAIAIIERAETASNVRNAVTWAPERKRTVAVRHLEQIPLDTPYTTVVEKVQRVANRLAADYRVQVFVDATGVGKPVVDMMHLPGARWSLHPVNIGFQDQAIHHDGGWHIGKRNLVSHLQVAFEFDELRICEGLADTETLIQELAAMKARTSASTGHTKYESPGPQHDDLAIAVALAWWAADTKKPGILGVDKPLPGIHSK